MSPHRWLLPLLACAEDEPEILREAVWFYGHTAMNRNSHVFECTLDAKLFTCPQATRVFSETELKARIDAHHTVTGTVDSPTTRTTAKAVFLGSAPVMTIRYYPERGATGSCRSRSRGVHRHDASEDRRRGGQGNHAWEARMPENADKTHARW